MATTPPKYVPPKPKAPKVEAPTKKVESDFKPNPQADPDFIQKLQKKQAGVKVAALTNILSKAKGLPGAAVTGVGLGTAAAAPFVVGSMANKAGEAAGKGIVDRAMDKGKELFGKGKELVGKGIDYAKANPWKAGGIAAGTVGAAALLAYLLRKRRASRSTLEG